jgi:stringent starvation protein B
MVEFQARFGGIARQLSIPVEQVSAIYARENGAGMSFEIETAKTGAFADAPAVTATPEAPDDPPPEPTAPESGRPKLQRIK